jgi:hypothetical protein
MSVNDISSYTLFNRRQWDYTDVLIYVLYEYNFEKHKNFIIL